MWNIDNMTPSICMPRFIALLRETEGTHWNFIQYICYILIFDLFFFINIYIINMYINLDVQYWQNDPSVCMPCFIALRKINGGAGLMKFLFNLHSIYKFSICFLYKYIYYIYMYPNLAEKKFPGHPCHRKGPLKFSTSILSTFIN